MCSRLDLILVHGDATLDQGAFFAAMAPAELGKFTGFVLVRAIDTGAKVATGRLLEPVLHDRGGVGH